MKNYLQNSEIYKLDRIVAFNSCSAESPASCFPDDQRKMIRRHQKHRVKPAGSRVRVKSTGGCGARCCLLRTFNVHDGSDRKLFHNCSRRCRRRRLLLLLDQIIIFTVKTIFKRKCNVFLCSSNRKISRLSKLSLIQGSQFFFHEICIWLEKCL